jgi:hypothetical protein
MFVASLDLARSINADRVREGDAARLRRELRGLGPASTSRRPARTRLPRLSRPRR